MAVRDGEAYLHGGMDDGGVSYLWRTDGESSAEWPVCVYREGEPTVLSYGIVEFLARACTTGLPGKLQRRFDGDGHEFLTWKDLYRRDAERYGFGSHHGGWDEAAGPRPGARPPSAAPASGRACPAG
ncbi:hypothetical protein ACIRVF_37155 [Kitasatospora sp. NPDC101157]|uniref:hypothetical protein n=1 Tax=Kitasatospora sp. NPDC101157 TaxID=3364098 RepID=UPI0037F53C6C